VTAALVGSTLLSACGTSDEDKIREAVRSFNLALADGDGPRACSYMTGDAIRKMARAGAPSCKAVIELAHQALDKQMLKAFRTVRYDRIRVRDDHATVRFRVLSQAGTQRLTKVRGEWRLEAPQPPR